MTPSDWGAIVAAVFAGGSLWVSACSYRQAKGIEKRLLLDEKMEFGQALNPDSVSLPDHRRAVIHIGMANLGHRKAVIRKVIVRDPSGREILVTWSDKIDSLGNVEDRRSPISVADSSSLYIRDNRGVWFDTGTTIEIHHSQTNSPSTVTFTDLDVTP
ncbi:hypothetical protein ACCQ08_13775 [Comamonas sp. SY3]|uniref:hypothetical protein n=1 Tax=Comamonas sp. SY3 TaxID=3243601 RepID=UPI0035943644